MVKVLIIEDNTSFRQSLKMMLQMQFPSTLIEEAMDGKVAFQKIDVSPPNLIFMDIGLPGENGLELTKKIKKGHSQIIIIVLTSYNSAEYRQAAYACGADYFITKGDMSIEEIAVLAELIISSK